MTENFTVKDLISLMEKCRENEQEVFITEESPEVVSVIIGETTVQDLMFALIEENRTLKNQIDELESRSLFEEEAAYISSAKIEDLTYEVDSLTGDLEELKDEYENRLTDLDQRWSEKWEIEHGINKKLVKVIEDLTEGNCIVLI
jgi:ubiquinone biosynthesis protein UbiJ